MHYIVIIALIINLHISLMQATCIKTLKLPEINQFKATTVHRIKRSTDSSNGTTATGEDIITDNHHRHDSSKTKQEQCQVDEAVNQQDQQQQSEQIIFNEHDNLRLEYYKYKILSQLSMTAEPTAVVNPNLNTTFRDELISDIGRNYINKFVNERAGNGVANLRHKRSLACNQVKSNKDACCLETFYVNFTEIGWDKWIIYPGGYNANYCRGQCDLSHSRYYHSTLLSKFSDVIGLCCSPRQLGPLRLLYIDEQNKVHQKTMPDMVVESCDCA